MSIYRTHANYKIKRMQPLALDEFEFLRGVTKLVAKITLPAPLTMHFYRCNEFADKAIDKDVGSFFADVAAVFQQEIGEVAAAGCHYVQLDEVAVALLCDPSIREQIARPGSNPDALVDLYIDSINQAVAGCPPNVTVGVHMCRGNFKGHYLGAGGYAWSPSAFSPVPMLTTSCSSTTRRAPAISRRSASYQRTKASCSASSAGRCPRWKPRYFEVADREGNPIH